MLCSLLSELDEGQVGQVGALEEELGVTLLAFTCHALDPASLDEGQLKRINDLEEKLGISLVAVAA